MTETELRGHIEKIRNFATLAAAANKDGPAERDVINSALVVLETLCIDIHRIAENTTPLNIGNVFSGSEPDREIKSTGPIA